MKQTNEIKAEYRRQMLYKRRNLSEVYIEQQSQAMLQHLRDWSLYRQARSIMLYLSMQGEPRIELVCPHAWAEGKKVYVPRLLDKFGIMDAVVITGFDDFDTGPFGLRIPKAQVPVMGNLDGVDLVLVPGVAFDRQGNRIGMGAGYYDRFLAKLPAANFAGVCWGFQVVEGLSGEEHDVSMDYLLTEEGILKCN